ncbi:hypothetical protein BaRGS_00036690, partial [Batillaria attramentaria]
LKCEKERSSERDDHRASRQKTHNWDRDTPLALWCWGWQGERLLVVLGSPGCVSIWRTRALRGLSPVNQLPLAFLSPARHVEVAQGSATANTSALVEGLIPTSGYACSVDTRLVNCR